jgi:hypothetical protein
VISLIITTGALDPVAGFSWEGVPLQSRVYASKSFRQTVSS